METKILCSGIDVSHSTLNVCYQDNIGELFHLRFGNNNAGYKRYSGMPAPMFYVRHTVHE